MHAMSSNTTAAHLATLTAARATDESHAIAAIAAAAALDPTAIRAAYSSPTMHLHARLVHNSSRLVIVGAKVSYPGRGWWDMVSGQPLLLRLPRM